LYVAFKLDLMKTYILLIEVQCWSLEATKKNVRTE